PTVPYVWPAVGSTLQFYKDPKLFAMTSTLNHGRSFRAHLHGRLTTVVGAKNAADVLRNPNMSFLASKFKYIGPNFLFPTKSIIFPKAIIAEIVKKHLTPNLDIYGPRSYKKVSYDYSYVAENLLPFVRDMVSRSNATAFIGPAASQREDLIHTFKTCANEIAVEQKPSLVRLIFPFINSLYIRLLRPQSTKIAQHKQNIRNAIVAELDNKNKMKELGLESEEKYLIDYVLETYPYEVNDDYIDSLTYVITMFIFVGIHTTAEAANQVLYRLMLHNEYIEELLQEQEDIFSGQPDAEFVPALSKKMVKLDSFIREVLRCRSDSLGLLHKHIGTDDLELSPGVVIHPGTNVFNICTPPQNLKYFSI
ncbi:cytochrome P450, partial [Backusella circina FSU 941]